MRENCVHKYLPYFFALFCQTKFYDKKENMLMKHNSCKYLKTVVLVNSNVSIGVPKNLPCGFGRKNIQSITSDGQLTRLVDHSIFIITFTYPSQILATNLRFKRTRMAFSRDQNILVKTTFCVTIGVPNTASFAIFHSCSFILQRKPCDSLQQIIPFIPHYQTRN